MPTDPSYFAATQTRIYLHGKRRISHFGLYLVGTNGARRRFNFGRDADHPFWVDRNHLAWREKRPGRYELWGLALPLFRRHRIVAAKKLQIDDDNTIHADGKTFRLSSIGIQGSQELLIPFKSQRTHAVWKGQTYRIENPGQKWHAADVEDGDIDLSQLGETGWGGHSARVGPYLFVAGSFSYTMHESSALLLRLDPKARTARILPQDAAEIDFLPGGHRFAAVSDRMLDAWEGVAVWRTKLYVGTLPSGHYREVPLPFAYTTSMRIRP